MSELGEHFRAVQEDRRETRLFYFGKRHGELVALQQAGHTVQSFNNGHHLRIDGKLDLWPSTGRWYVVGTTRTGWMRQEETVLDTVKRVFAANGRRQQ